MRGRRAEVSLKDAKVAVGGGHSRLDRDDVRMSGYTLLEKRRREEYPRCGFALMRVQRLERARLCRSHCR